MKLNQIQPSAWVCSLLRIFLNKKFLLLFFLGLHSKDPVNEPLRPYKPRQDISMPDVITVRIDEGIQFLFFSLNKNFFSNQDKI